MNPEALSDLIGAIYDCTLDPGLWPATLESICDHLQSTAGTLSVADFASGQERIVVNVGVAPVYLSLYRERFQCADLFLHGLMLRDVDEPVPATDLATEAEIRESRLYREWAAPQGFYDTVHSVVMKRPGRLGYFGLTRTLEQPRYGESDRSALRLLTPHIRRSVTIADLLDHKAVERAQFESVIARLSSAVLLLDDAGRLVYANSAGERLLQRGTMLVMRQGIVQAASDEQAAGLLASRSGGTARTVHLRERDGGRRALATVLPLSPRCEHRFAIPTAACAVFVQDAADGPVSSAEAIGRAFGLTGAELRVLMGLIEGLSVKDIASLYGLSVTTIRTHLQGLFAKTGVHRQAGVVRVALTALPPVRE